MLDLEYLKQFREIKDIEDIIQDIEKLNSSIYWNDWNEVNQHIQKVSIKYPVEATVYNSVRVPAQTIQQAVEGCRQFLLSLGAEKITKELSKYLDGN